VPVAGRQFAQRRLIRGVGAAERAVGNAWGRLTSRQREYYGNQRNFAGGMQRESNRRGDAEEEANAQAEREQGRQDAMGNAPPPAKPTNHAQDVIDSPKMRGYIKKEVDDDMYPEGKPKALPAKEQLSDAVINFRVRDISHPSTHSATDAEVKTSSDRGFDNGMPHDDPKIARSRRLKAKGYQMESNRRFAERRQKPMTAGNLY